MGASHDASRARSKMLLFSSAWLYSKIVNALIACHLRLNSRKPHTETGRLSQVTSPESAFTQVKRRQNDYTFFNWLISKSFSYRDQPMFPPDDCGEKEKPCVTDFAELYRQLSLRKVAWEGDDKLNGRTGS